MALTEALMLLATVLYVACLPLSNGNVREHLLHWTAYFVEHGRFAALGYGFSENAPPYLCLLSTGTLLAPLIGQLAVIKLVSVAGTLFRRSACVGCSPRSPTGTPGDAARRLERGFSPP